ncbi:hypothetical protein [Salinibacter altiplanensis]|uniref:hypothetical protein n=1 Tax=Salinibacter altiplanensis TaxID=1803181 RepID=UPI000C9F3FA0|nr:hypothetical protein [Salinibacter altiplanensis]
MNRDLADSIQQQIAGAATRVWVGLEDLSLPKGHPNVRFSDAELLPATLAVIREENVFRDGHRNKS